MQKEDAHGPGPFVSVRLASAAAAIAATATMVSRKPRMRVSNFTFQGKNAVGLERLAHDPWAHLCPSATADGIRQRARFHRNC